MYNIACVPVALRAVVLILSGRLTMKSLLSGKVTLRRFIAGILTLALVFTLMPAGSVFASDEIMQEDGQDICTQLFCQIESTLMESQDATVL